MQATDLEKIIQEKQNSVSEQLNRVNDLKEVQIQAQKEFELQKVELDQLKTLNSTLKAKLADA